MYTYIQHIHMYMYIINFYAYIHVQVFYPIEWVDQRLLAECIQLTMRVELITGV